MVQSIFANSIGFNVVCFYYEYLQNMFQIWFTINFWGYMPKNL